MVACMLVARLSLLLSAATAFRPSRRPRENSTLRVEGSPASVTLYSFGAPRTATRRLSVDGSRCFEGLRVLNMEYQRANYKDVVSMVAPWLRHPSLPTLILMGADNRSSAQDCDWDDSTWGIPSVNLHDFMLYVSRSMQYGGHLGTVADVGLRYSYDKAPLVAEEVKQKGWTLVGSATAFPEQMRVVSHLIQHPRSLNCLLTFHGTDSLADWGHNLNVILTDWCGYTGIQKGWVSALSAVISSADWKSNMRPNLPFCNHIDVIAHSLGGAMATLWTACVKSVLEPHTNSSQYADVRITWQKPKQLPPFIA